jgi:hypothetical protein
MSEEPKDVWRNFDNTLAEVRSRFADLPPDELEALIDEALATARANSPKGAP